MVEFTLRSINENDHHFLVELHNDPLVLRNVTDPTPVTIESHMKWWNEIQESSKEERFIFCVDGIPTGLAKIYKIDKTNKSCKLGADIHKDFRGRGYAKELWKLMIDRCFVHHQLHRLALTTAEYNEIGIRLYRGLGFEEEGRKIKSLCREGRFYDEICMYMLKKDY